MALERHGTVLAPQRVSSVIVEPGAGDSALGSSQHARHASGRPKPSAQLVRTSSSVARLVPATSVLEIGARSRPSSAPSSRKLSAAGSTRHRGRSTKALVESVLPEVQHAGAWVTMSAGAGAGVSGAGVSGTGVGVSVAGAGVSSAGTVGVSGGGASGAGAGGGVPGFSGASAVKAGRDTPLPLRATSRPSYAAALDLKFGPSSFACGQHPAAPKGPRGPGRLPSESMLYPTVVSRHPNAQTPGSECDSVGGSRDGVSGGEPVLCVSGCWPANAGVLPSSDGQVHSAFLDIMTTPRQQSNVAVPKAPSSGATGIGVEPGRCSSGSVGSRSVVVADDDEDASEVDKPPFHEDRVPATLFERLQHLEAVNVVLTRRLEEFRQQNVANMKSALRERETLLVSTTLQTPFGGTMACIFDTLTHARTRALLFPLTCAWLLSSLSSFCVVVLQFAQDQLARVSTSRGTSLLPVAASDSHDHPAADARWTARMCFFAWWRHVRVTRGVRQGVSSLIIRFERQRWASLLLRCFHQWRRWQLRRCAIRRQAAVVSVSTQTRQDAFSLPGTASRGTNTVAVETGRGLRDNGRALSRSAGTQTLALPRKPMSTPSACQTPSSWGRYGSMRVTDQERTSVALGKWRQFVSVTRRIKSAIRRGRLSSLRKAWSGWVFVLGHTRLVEMLWLVCARLRPFATHDVSPHAPPCLFCCRLAVTSQHLLLRLAAKLEAARNGLLVRRVWATWASASSRGHQVRWTCVAAWYARVQRRHLHGWAAVCRRVRLAARVARARASKLLRECLNALVVHSATARATRAAVSRALTGVGATHRRQHRIIRAAFSSWCSQSAGSRRLRRAYASLSSRRRLACLRRVLFSWALVTAVAVRRKARAALVIQRSLVGLGHLAALRDRDAIIATLSASVSAARSQLHDAGKVLRAHSEAWTSTRQAARAAAVTRLGQIFRLSRTTSLRQAWTTWTNFRWNSVKAQCEATVHLAQSAAEDAARRVRVVDAECARLAAGNPCCSSGYSPRFSCPLVVSVRADIGLW